MPSHGSNKYVMNNCWYKLKIDTKNFLKDDWHWPENPKEFKVGQEGHPEKLLTPTAIDYLSSIGLTIKDIMLFSRPPQYRDRSAHIDIRGTGNGEKIIKNINGAYTVKYALNFVLHGRGSEMLWYDNPPKLNTIFYTTAGTPFVSRLIDNLTLIDRCEIDSTLTLTRVDQLHAVFVADEPRLSISMRTSNDAINTWDDAVNYLRSKDLLIER